ncbi:MAG TPA: VWA domain-containing protein [Mobilitalea sp.]|nr:VWA domain-containing protein [Mobilitalea sp.]
MNKDLTEIVFLLDRSGSMTGLEADTIGGFNSFIQRQCSLGKTNLTTILFDNKYEILHNGVDASTVTLTEKDYFTRSSTALLDAIGRAILDVNFRLSQLDKDNYPGKVIFVITTDGLENSSTEFTYDRIRQLIARQKELYNWEFIFMGANMDVIKESQKLGIHPSMSFNFQASSKGTKQMYQKVDHIVSEIRLNQIRSDRDDLSILNF